MNDQNNIEVISKKTHTFDEAFKSVIGTKMALIHKYTKFLNSSISFEDLQSEADAAIYRAWVEWDESTKFNSYAYNHITWALKDYLNEMHPRWKINAVTTYELWKKGETFTSAKEIGKTSSKEFNELHGLDGSDEAKNKFNRDMWNEYINFITDAERPISLISESKFISDEENDFNIMDTSDAVEDEYKKSNSVVFEEYHIPLDEFDEKLASLDDYKKQVAKMLLDGMTVNEIIQKMGMTKSEFMAKFDNNTIPKNDKAKRKRLKAIHREKLLAQKKAAKEAVEY